jgi:hypothetical protein
MRYTVLISLLMMLIHTTSLAETATSGNLLPNAGTGTTALQNSSGTIDGINGSTGWTTTGITNFGSELEVNGTGSVSATGTLEGISTTKTDGSSFTTTADSLDGGVRLNSTTEVQNCEWTGSAYQCGNAQAGQDTYSTTVNILDEDENVLATVTQNRNTDAGYYGNTFTYTDTVIHTGEGARKWDWEWTGTNVANPNTTSADGPNLLGAQLLATLLDIDYSALPETIKNEIVEIFGELDDEFKEVEDIIEEFFIEEEIAIKEEPVKMEEPVMMVMMEIKEEEKFEEEAAFEEPIMLLEEEKEEESNMEVMEMLTEEEEKEELDNSTEEGIIEVSEKESKEEEKNEQPEEVKEDESDGETTKTANASKKNSTKQKNLQSKETKTISHTDILNKIDEKIKDIGKNLELKNLITLKAMSENDILLSTYNVPFYQPKTIYVDQVNITDNREIYNNINLNSYIQDDPIAIRANKINELNIERQQLLIQLEELKNG